MVKQQLYPKTKRVGKNEISITEKLDGSNIGFFKLDGKLIISQRNSVMTWTPEESEVTKTNAYKGLIGWLEENGKTLLDNLHEESGFFGEWIGMGQLKYTLPHKVYMFAKANISFIDEKYEVKNIIYSRDLFRYPFIDMVIPDFIGVVFEVIVLDDIPTIKLLDVVYDGYLKLVKRPVEGFVINVNNNISKYVRNKGGKLGPHEVK